MPSAFGVASPLPGMGTVPWRRPIVKHTWQCWRGALNTSFLPRRRDAGENWTTPKRQRGPRHLRTFDICMNTPCELLITGAGLLSRRFCCDFAQTYRQAATVVIAGRSHRRTSELVHLGNVRAVNAGSRVRFRSRLIDWQSSSSVDELFGTLQPKVVLHTASLQSPWELRKPTAWAELIARAGFGVTLPLQATLALKLASALRRSCLNPIVLNACYPDCVNAVLRQRGLPIHAGIGNVAIIAAVLNTTLKPRHHPLLVIAHHYHLAALISGKGRMAASHLPQVWCGERRVAVPSSAYRPLKAICGPELNNVTSCAAASFVAALLNGATMLTHAPGPVGLIGGYPIKVAKRAISVLLPEAVALNDAIEWNQAASRLDGVTVGKGTIKFSGPAHSALRRHVSQIPPCFPVSDTEDICKELLALKSRLDAVV
jgi:hypothetical protein